MTILHFLLLLLIAGVCGSIAQALVGFSRGGCLVSIALQPVLYDFAPVVASLAMNVCPLE